MKIDRALKEFTERYNDEMIASIDDLSKELGCKVNGYTIDGSNISESAQMFKGYLEGYTNFVINKSDKATREEIFEKTNEFINTQLFKKEKIAYPDLPKYVKAYIESVKMILEATNKAQSDLITESVDSQYVADVNEFVESFMDKLQGSFYPTMDRILWASGYNARQRLSATSTKEKSKSQTPIFI